MLVFGVLFQKISSSLKFSSSKADSSSNVKNALYMTSAGIMLNYEMSMTKEKSCLAASGKLSESRGMWTMIWRTFIMPQRYWREADL